MRNLHWFLALVALLLSVGGPLVERPTAQTLLQVLEPTGSPVQKPISVSVAPSQEAFAVADQYANRIVVFDQQGSVRWTIGQSAPLNQPLAVCFESDVTVLFSQKGDLTIYRCSEIDPSAIDTVADLSANKKHLESIDRILRTKDNLYIVLDRSRGEITRFTSTWAFDRVLVKNGNGQGSVWEPTDIALDLAGNILVTDAGPFPVQSFRPDGSFRFYGGWNGPDKNRVWVAGAVAVSPLGIIWAADETGAQWRQYDQTGTERGRVPYTPPVTRPVAMAISAGQRMVVLDDHGAVALFSLE